MRMTNWIASGIILAALAGPAADVRAQGNADGGGSFGAMINVPALVDNYARFLARKYNLNDEQEQFTVDMLHKKTQEFLANHEGDMFELYSRMTEVRAGGEMTQEELIGWGKKALPIYEDAKALIVNGNDEWRAVLTEEQRKLHDADIEMMYESFRTTDEQMHRIVLGEMTVDEFRSPQRNRRRGARPQQAQRAPVVQDPAVVQPQQTQQQIEPPDEPSPDREQFERDARAAEAAAAVADAQPERVPNVAPPARATGQPNPRDGRVPPRGPGADQPNRPNRPGRSGNEAQLARGSDKFESEWERYVREFCDRYKLDDAQRQAANRILADCQEQANSYMNSKKPQVEQLDKQIAAATGPEGAKQAGELRKERDKLFEPIGRIFDKVLKPRLERIPTRAQRREADAAPTGSPKVESGQKSRP